MAENDLEWAMSRHAPTLPWCPPKRKRKNVCVFKNRSTKDPWDNAYQYRYPGKKDPARFDLFSLGKDGVAETADDIQVPKAAADRGKE